MQRVLGEIKKFYVDPTGDGYSSLSDYASILTNLPKKCIDSSTRLEKQITAALEFTQEKGYVHDKPVVGKLYAFPTIEWWNGDNIYHSTIENKHEYVHDLCSDGIVTMHSVGEALILLNELLLLPNVQNSNNQQFAVFIKKTESDAGWIGFHRGNSRNYRFWFWEYLKDLPTDIPNYFIS